MKRAIALLIRVTIAIVFVSAGFQKASDPGAFVADLWNYRLLPEDLAYWVAAYLPYLEIVAGLALLCGLQRQGAHLLLAAMLLVFLLSLGSAWWRDLDIACGCFGSSAGDAPANLAWPVTRNLLLLGGVAASSWIQNTDARPPAGTG